MQGEKVQDLRYGENPHQKAAFYRRPQVKGACVANGKQLQGKELSFNNIIDLNAALELVREFPQTACVIIKHTNPCGTALGNTVCEAYLRALEADPVSAYGGIVGLQPGSRCSNGDGNGQNLPGSRHCTVFLSRSAPDYECEAQYPPDNRRGA